MINTARLTITETPVIVDTPEPDCGGHTIIVSNVGMESVYLDGASATPENSFELLKKQTLSIAMAPDGKLYAVTAAGKTTVICTLVTHR